jgi:hypothetical protein
MNAVEQEWIERFRNRGEPLCNVREGGGGGGWTAEAKQRHSELCRPINQRLGSQRRQVA